MPESSFSFNSPVPPELHLADVHSQLYQTPSTTSASSSLRTISTSNRKRSRIDEPGKPCPLYNSSADDSDDDLQHSSWLGRRHDDAVDLGYHTPNSHGQIPLAPPIEASLDSLTVDKPPGNSRKRSRRGAWVGGAAEQDMEAVDEKNGLPSSARTSWSQSVINVVGKVWNFCWSGAFRGFHAGGGRGYHMPAGSAPQLDEESSPSRQHMSTEKPVAAPATRGTTSDYYFTHHESTPVPGQYPDDSDIQKNWVVVPTDGAADCYSFDVENSRPSTPTKRSHRISEAPGSSQSRYKSATAPRVGKRISLSGQSTPTRIPMLSPGSGKLRQSPVSVETQRYVAQMRRMEREEDASLRRLNRQLQTMIKEGKQALGTQVEIDDLDMGDDY